MTKKWAKGRTKGVHCVRLDDETHELAKKEADKREITIKDFIQLAIKHFTLNEH